jgi:hypothetical protein
LLYSALGFGQLFPFLFFLSYVSFTCFSFHFFLHFSFIQINFTFRKANIEKPKKTAETIKTGKETHKTGRKTKKKTVPKTQRHAVKHRPGR